jgi:hypothetical protein
VTRTGIAPVTSDGLSEVILDTGTSGGNQVQVESSSADCFLNLGVGSGDTVIIGQPLEGSNTATLANILGSVAVSAGSGTPSVVVDNSADASGHQVTAEQTAYGVALEGLAPADLYFQVGPTANVQVNPGSGNVSGLDAFFALLAQGT